MLELAVHVTCMSSMSDMNYDWAEAIDTDAVSIAHRCFVLTRCQ